MYRRILLLVLLFTSWIVKAQGVADMYKQGPTARKGIGFRVGMNYSSPTATARNVPQPLYPMDVLPGYGFYVGEFFYKDLIAERLILRLDATFQAKGSTYVDINGRHLGQANYFYLGLTPQLGFQLASKLVAFTGIEANKLVATKRPWGEIGQSFEIGTTIRVNYNVGKFGAELSYFRAFSRFDRMEKIIPQKYIDLYNKNIQLGLIYYWKQKN